MNELEIRSCGEYYLVFASEADADDYEFLDLPGACFGGFLSAYLLGDPLY
jgi:hypothetical protein